MLKEHWKIISGIARATDNIIIVASFFLAHQLRDPLLSLLDDFSQVVPGIGRLFSGVGFNPGTTTELGSVADYLIILLATVPIYNFLLSGLGAYKSMRFRNWGSLLKLSAVVSGLVFLCCSALLFILNLDLSRSFLSTFCLTAFAAIFSERLVVLALLRYFRAKGRNFRNLLIVGTGDQAEKIFKEIVSSPELGIRVQGFVSLEETPPQWAMAVNSQLFQRGLALSEGQVGQNQKLSARVIANAETFEETLKKYAIDEVLFTDPEKNYEQIKSLSALAAEEGLSISFAAMFFDFNLSRSTVSNFGSIPLVHYETAPSSTGTLVIKRLIDIICSTIVLFLFSPLMFLTAVAIKLESIGPVFFRQKRVGLNGRIFTLLKFRSMCDQAEKQLSKLKARNEMSGPVFKLREDPRVTKVGKFIRRYSIDELPQLFNVLKGEMSLVGPRPPLPNEVKEYRRKHRRRLSMRPGITCTWQVSGRNNIPCFEEWTELDLEYIDNWSLKRDLSLLLRTIPAVITGRGAN